MYVIKHKIERQIEESLVGLVFLFFILGLVLRRVDFFISFVAARTSFIIH